MKNVGNITYNGKTFEAYIEDFGGNAILHGHLGWCRDIIEMASGGLYDLTELEKVKGNFNGPDTFTIGNTTYNGCKWTSVRHTDSCSCCCWGEAKFDYETKVVI